METEEAILKTKERINLCLDIILENIVEAKQKMRSAESIPEIMEAMKSFMGDVVDNLPLDSWENPYCWLLAEKIPDEEAKPWNPYRFPQKKEDCKQCEYAEVYGNCFEKSSVGNRIIKAQARFLYAIERSWKKEEKEHRNYRGGGMPG